MNNVFTLFGRAAQAFRTPDVDERVASGPAFDAFFNPIPQTFNLKTQTSRDVELGYRIKNGPFQMQTSIYTMDLENEIHFDPVNFFNVNLRSGKPAGTAQETAASYRCVSTTALLLRGWRGLHPRGVSRGPIHGQ